MRPVTATRTLLALERRFRRHRRAVMPAVVLVGALAVVAPLSSAALLWLLKLMINTVFVARRLDAMPLLVASYFALASAKFGADSLRRRLDVAIAERINHEVRADVYRHVMTLPEPSVTGRGVGDLLAHLSSDVERVEYVVFNGPVILIGDLAAALFFTAVLFTMNWQLALVAFATAPFLALVVVRRAPRVKRVARVARRQATSWLTLAEETLGALPMVHAFQAHAREVGRFRARSDVARRAEIRSVAVQAQLTLLVEMIAVVGGLVVLVVAAHHVSSGAMTLGAVVAFLGSLGSLYEPARDLGQIASRFQRAAAGAHRVADLLDTRGTVVERASAVTLPRSTGRIEFRDVHFAYPRGASVLNGVSFTVEPGEIVAIVGASGSGKSTLVRLLLRFHDARAGAVLIDGADVRDVTLASLRANVAVAFQDPYVVQGSIADNVRYGRPDASEADVARAVQAARAETFVHAFRRQSAAAVGARGERLSGGQRQRLALARVFLRDAPILVLDEATAAVDSETEELIHASIQRFARRRTIVVIGHRLATVRQADRVVVLEGGRITEIGAPASLLQHGNRCYDLFAGQLGSASVR
ncbi:MAG: hypothetical protein AUH30_01085 [Candidatus Rokubacteria bacterium 13_1_40CM_68_15]|nr:MAG: hypothetical protein AUH30_01085 [Candidatus Rokubacteria bacterium 13_1_40CM_68_15]